MMSLQRSSKRKSLAQVAIAALLTLTLVACGSTGSGNSGQGSDDLSDQTWLVPQDWGALDPGEVVATNAGSILLVMEPLVLVNPHGGVIANLAEQDTPTPTTFTYTLRDDATFSDGSPVTIDDVLYSFEIHFSEDSTSPLAGRFGGVDSLTATADNELTIELVEPNVQFENSVAQIGIVSKTVREALGENPGTPGNFNVGSGPYVVDSYTPGSTLVLTANEEYWGEAPPAENLTLKVVSDDSARLLAVKSGSVTGAFEVPASQAETYADTDGMKLISGVSPSVMLFNVQTDKAPWDDINVRRAVSKVIDRSGIVDAVLAGKGEPTVSIVSRDDFERVSSSAEADALYAELAINDSDPEGAQADMAASAHPHGFDATVIFSAAEPNSGLVAQAIAADVKQLGINLTVQSVPDAQYTDEVFFQHTAPAAIVDFTTDMPDPVSLANYLSNSSGTLEKGGYTNIANYTNDAQDEVIDSYLRTPSTESAQRVEYLTSMLKNLAEEAAYIPIYKADYLAVVNSGIDFEDFDGMWWMRRWVDDIVPAS